jgi:chorismate mutase/prephenate dehydratase
MKIGCLGPEASYSFQAVKDIYPEAEIVLCNSFPSIFDLVITEGVDFGIVPIENSTGGSVSIVLDELISKNVFINSEYYLKIKHSFLSNYKFEDVKQIFSHPQGFAQCKKWIVKKASDKELIEVSSTSNAAKKASQVDFSGAIASEMAADKFGLNIVENDINDKGRNETRFIVFSKKQNDSKNMKKTSLIFGAKNKPGSLFNILESFKNEKINLTKLESRPSQTHDWEYLFFVDFEGNLENENVKRAIENIKNNAIEVKILGSYLEFKK